MEGLSSCNFRNQASVVSVFIVYRTYQAYTLTQRVVRGSVIVLLRHLTVKLCGTERVLRGAAAKLSGLKTSACVGLGLNMHKPSFNTSLRCHQLYVRQNSTGAVMK